MSDISTHEADSKMAAKPPVSKSLAACPPASPSKRFRKLGWCFVLLTIALVVGTILIEASSTRKIQVTATASFGGQSKWNPGFWVGNFDEPLPWTTYRPNNPYRLLLWRLRNPLHNLTFYIIGIADKDFSRVGRFPDTVFNPDDGWNWAVCRYKWARLPFLSYKNGGLCAYAGWRERGNFGLTLRYHRDPPINEEELVKAQ